MSRFMFWGGGVAIVMRFSSIHVGTIMFFLNQIDFITSCGTVENVRVCVSIYQLRAWRRRCLLYYSLFERTNLFINAILKSISYFFLSNTHTDTFLSNSLHYLIFIVKRESYNDYQRTNFSITMSRNPHKRQQLVNELLMFWLFRYLCLVFL